MDDLQAYYALDKEEERLLVAEGRLELERTMRVLARFVAPGSRVADVGGGTGRYAEWAVGLGCEVELLDPVPLHVERARARGLSAQVGDARSLPWADASFDAVLPDELRSELVDAGLEVQGLYGLEGPGWLAQDLVERLDDPESRARLLEVAERFEEDPHVLGLSPHLLAVGVRP